jgi:hypothetical protein
MAAEIRIFNCALEHDDHDFNSDVLRGTIDQTYIRLLKSDWYQRQEGFSEKEIRELVELYFQHEKVPDVIVGMRGHRYRKEDNDFWLQDPCYVIDGVQRLLAARVALHSRPDLKLRIGAKLFLDTTSESENALFCKINATQQRVSASVLIRNKYKVSNASRLLYDLGSNTSFALKDRIGWDQKLSPGQSMGGFGLACIAGALHMHKGSTPAGRAYDLLEGLDNVVVKISEETFVKNLITFFDVVDECWSIRGDKNSKCLKREFLSVLARLLSSYETFWDAEDLFIAEKYMKRLSSFDIGSINNQVKQMTKSNRDVKDVFFEVLRNRLKLDAFSGRRSPKDATAGARATV